MNNKYEKVQEQVQFEGLIQGLIDNDFAYCDDFVTELTLIGLRANMQLLHDENKMEFAGLGNNMDFQKDKLIRGDKINWIEELSTNSFEAIYIQKVQDFISYLNRTCFAAITSFESHYAHYEQHSFYKKHIDQFKSEKGRKYSIILYLNNNWKTEDGGLLSLYPVGEALENITPLGGRLVFFRSDEMEHEVHPSFTRDRKSIAAWFKT